MTVRSRDYPRGAASAPLLLVLAALAAAAPRVWAATAAEALAACPHPFYEPTAKTFVIPPSPAMCDSLKSYQEPFGRLLKAADFAENGVPLWGRIDPATNAAFYRGAKVVMVNTATLEKYPRPTEAMLFVLAHELGHAVQERGGEMAWRFAEGLAKAETERRSRVTEGQADHIAVELLAKSGLGGARATVQGVQQFFTCDRIQDESEKGTTHPAPKDRFLAPLKQGSLLRPPAMELDDVGLAAAFDQAARRGGGASAAGAVPADRGPRVYKPTLGVEDFDANGRPKTEGFRVQPVPAAAARSGPSGADAPSFWGRMAASAEAAVDEAMDRAWFNNPAVESVALKSCGVAKPADFNEAVTFGSVAWMRDTAAAMTGRLKGMLGRR